MNTKEYMPEVKQERPASYAGRGRGWRCLLLRPVMALVAGGITGAGIQYWWKRQADAPSPAVRKPEAEGVSVSISPGTPPPLDSAKVRAEARAWFTAASGRAEQGDLKKDPQALIDRIEALTSAELREWLDEGRSSGGNNAPMDMLMERWWEVDPTAFIQWIGMLAQQPRTKVTAGLTMWISSHQSLPDTNPPWYSFACRVLERLDPKAKPPLPPAPAPAGNYTHYTPPFVPPDEPAPETRPDFATLNAGEAARWLARNGGQMQELKQTAEKLARTDVRAALRWAQDIPRHLRERREALSAVLLKGNEDGAWILENVHLLERRADMEYALNNCAPLYSNIQGHLKVLEWMLGRTAPEERKAALNMLTHRLHYRDQDAATGILARLTDRAERSIYLEAMVARYDGEKDQKKLLSLITAEPGGGKEAMGAGVAARILATRKSVEEAIAWAESLPDDARQASALAAAYAVWARRDSTAAAQAARKLPAGDARTAVLVSLAVTRGERFPGEALKWSRTLDAAERVRILPQLAESLAQHHALEAREEVVQLLAGQPAAAEDELFQKAVWTLVPRLDTATGQTAAMQWIDRVPAGKLRDDLVARVKQEAGRVEAVKVWLEGQKQVP